MGRHIATHLRSDNSSWRIVKPIVTSSGVMVQNWIEHASRIANFGLGVALGIGMAGWGLRFAPSIAQPIVPNDRGATQLSGNCAANCSIDGGITQGVNRFHSFSEFSIPPNATVQFVNNNPAVANAIARITGGNPTEIYGTLTSGGSTPSFNLFLLNPSGLLIGPGASINIQGAFVGSTADTVEFGNLGEWETNLRTSPAGLTIHPSALLFNRLQPQPVTISGASITTGVGRSLFLSGSDISFSLSSAIAPFGIITLAAVGSEGGRLGLLDLSLPQPVDFSSNPGRGDIEIGTPFVPTPSQPTPDPSTTLLLAPGGGNVVLRGANFSIEQAFVGQPGDQTRFRTLPSGRTSIELDVSNTARFRNTGLFFGDTFDSLPAGSISIRAGKAVILEGFRGAIASRTFGDGQGGKIDIQTDRLELRGSTRIAADTGGGGDGGTIVIVADSVAIGGGENPDSFKPAINTFSLSEVDLEFSRGDITLPETVGNAGEIKISAREIQLTDGSSLGTISNSGGNAGSIRLTIDDRLELSNRSAVSVASNKTGEAGNLTILSGEIELSNQSSLSAASENSSGGEIRLNVDELLLLRENSFISAEAELDGGSIDINAEFVVAGPNNNDITAASRLAETGNVVITARDVLGFSLNNQPSPDTSDITATSTITFDRIDNRDLTRETIEPSIIDPAIDPSRLVYDPCRVDAGETLEDIGQFVFAGRGGLPLGPNDPLQADFTDRPWVEHSTSERVPLTEISSSDGDRTIRQIPETIQDIETGRGSDTEQVSEIESRDVPFERPQIVEARGFGRDDSGQLILTASRPDAVTSSPAQPTHQCGDLFSR